MVYLDTGRLLKLHYPEPDSDLVASRAADQTIAYTSLHALELATEQADAALDAVQEDVDAGKLAAADVALLDSFNKAVRLARDHGAIIGCRALDTLHCAMAESLQVSGFVSTDTRQRALARIMGLRVMAL